MKLIMNLIKIAIAEAYELGQVGWHPDDGIPESFQAECEVEGSIRTDGFSFMGDYSVTIFNTLVLIDAESFECWHSGRLTYQPE